MSIPALAERAEERVRQLEQKIQQMDANEIERNSKLAQALAALDRLQTQVQSLGGGSEAQTVQIQQFKEAMERMYRDLEMRLNALEGQLKLFQSELSRALMKVAPGLEKERAAFQKGLDFVQTAQYAQAVAAFQQFMKQNPKSPQTAEALFWIGECRYASRDFQQAIKDYQKLADQFPKAALTPTAVLKQGDSFLNLAMKEEAKIFWNKLIREYPSSTEAQQARNKLESLSKTGTAITLPAPPAVFTPNPTPAPESPSNVPIPPQPRPTPAEDF